MPGVIAAVSGLLTSVAGFLVVLNTLGVLEKSKPLLKQNPPIADKEGATGQAVAPGGGRLPLQLPS